MRLVAIHQPNFFPWLGYFDKWARSHRFVLLDNVQFEKSGHGSWVNRVRLQVGGKPYWVTAPVVRSFSGTRLIQEMELDATQKWRERTLRGLELHYARAPFFREVIEVVRPLVAFPSNRLVEYNLNALRELGARVGLPEDRLVLASSLPVRGAATERLVGLVQDVGGEAYMSGFLAARTYQDPAVFERAGIRLVMQDFVHPTYPQYGAAEFVPGLSLLDALMNCGFEGTARLLGTR
ncbi:MAG: WbqC family protein [Candidatus Eremiobacterota bacterium]